MTEEDINLECQLRERQKQQSNGAKFGTYSILLSMVLMALWGWTPLKNIIPALPVLVAFLALVLAALVLTVFSLYRGMQVRSLKAKLEDQ